MAVVLAAGMGTRVGADGNKAYLRVAGRSMVAWSIDTLTQAPEIARTVLVFRRGERELAQDTIAREVPSATVEFVEGGDSRHASEFNVLRHLAPDIEAGTVDVIIIHDAARPVADPNMFVTALSLAREFGGAIPAIPVTDVVRGGADVDLESLPGPGGLVRVQTPQAFRAKPLLDAYRAAERDGFEGTDTSSCIETYADVEIRTFRGEQRNLKVTYARDIAVAERLLTSREGPTPCSR
ncbi:4-diphosphocytidyl-2-methyl-D-erythritol synthase [Mycolicibacterium rhodesiae NBB3]|uniref:4-diphosphocytidyl-2-methyl-D-erythritol synthase n=1 Tax=Mycolicibacterium rhodesiae (strain NBB3) TaxID=710685 RepID=G8RH86_MYCRN|nr:IspD/TarI family cytidylyltransferase [Mycolicibacterium rhodesiae]AEV74566.1 4-diphosphocytidyl-2-methyl-D-erythritol synthase [Mycolicibacterium rhodesiae NBB3]